MLEAIVQELIPRFEGMDEYFEKPEDSFAAFCQSQLSGGIAMQIRNEFNLWDFTSEAHQYFRANHRCMHPDEMSDLILRHVYRKKNKDKK